MLYPKAVLNLSTVLNKMAISNFDQTILWKKNMGEGAICPPIFDYLKRALELLISVRMIPFQTLWDQWLDAMTFEKIK
jgi:hypothetical protein